MNQIETNKSSMLKSLVWRIIGVFWLAGITWLFTRDLITVSWITFVHHSIFLVVFYLHERVWLRSRISLKYKAAIKAITYEVILGNLILGIISYCFTSSLQKMSAITLVYIQSKIVLYYVYDRVWSWIYNA